MASKLRAGLSPPRVPPPPTHSCCRLWPCVIEASACLRLWILAGTAGGLARVPMVAAASDLRSTAQCGRRWRAVTLALPDVSAAAPRPAGTLTQS